MKSLGLSTWLTFAASISSVGTPMYGERHLVGRKIKKKMCSKKKRRMKMSVKSRRSNR